MDPILGGAIVSGAGSLFSSLLGNSGNRKAQERANKMNIKFWEMQNAYNHPVEQMARLKQAGLNPNLIYGGSTGSASGMADKIAPAKAEPYSFNNPLNEISAFVNLRRQKLVNDNLEEQNKVIIQDAILKGMQSLKTQSEGESAKTKALLDKAMFGTSLQIQQQQLEDYKQKVIGQKIANFTSNQTAQAKIEEAWLKLGVLSKQYSNEQVLFELRTLEKQLKAEGLENAGPIVRWLYRQLQDGNSNLKYFYDLSRGLIEPKILD